MGTLDPIFYSPKTFARLTDTPVTTVRSWITRGVIPAIRIGGTIKIPATALEALTPVKAGEDK